MKVRELREKLNNIDPEIEVLCYCEDDRFLAEETGFVLFDISAISTCAAERVRLDDGTPYLKFAKEAGTVNIATLEITADF